MPASRLLTLALVAALALGGCRPAADDDDATTAITDDDDTAVAAAQSCASWGDPVARGTVEESGLSEISGLVVSAADPDLLWVHEDSAGPAEITALSLDGRVRGTVVLDGVVNVDWEDMAAGPCGDQTCLYVGDIGDNGNSRTDVSILRLPEPAVEQDGFELHVDPEVFAYAYADGPVDAEALLVDTAGLPVVIDKVNGGFATLHRLPSLQSGAQVVAEELAVIATGEEGAGLVALPTAADLTGDGSRLLVRTYGKLLEYRLGDEGLVGAGSVERSEVPHGVELQGESAAWAPDGLSVWHVAEGAGPTLWQVPCVEVVDR